MATIEFVDQTLRDGQQSLWGMRMRAGMIAPIAPLIDRAGFKAVEFTGGAIFEVLLRHVKEDPWEGLDLVAASLPNTHLRGPRRATAMGKFGLTPPAMLKLFNSTLIRHGIGSTMIYDCLYNMEKMKQACRDIVDAGGDVYPGIMFGISPVHTDEFFADRVREIVDWGFASGIYFEDAPGILTPERAATLLPALVEAAGVLKVEMHGHNTVGLGNLNYMEALKAGITIIHTCSRPLANGPSIPSTEAMVRNVQVAGHEVGLDTSVLEPIADHFERIAEQEGFQLGVPHEYDATLYLHQLPGGMTGTLKAQLREYGMQERLPEVIEEIAQVRCELGYPISATPFSQLIGIQSVLNVTTGERYSVIPDEVIMYALGHYGEPPMPIDDDVMDSILATDRARHFESWEQPDPSIEQLREEYGEGERISDEELCLRYLAPAADLAEMRSLGPLKTTYQFNANHSLDGLVEKVLNVSRARNVELRLPSMSVSVRRAVS